MIEHCPTRLSETQPIHQVCVRAACQAIRDQRRSLGTLLGLGGKPGQAAHRYNVG